jgi:hypothetical protein
MAPTINASTHASSQARSFLGECWQDDAVSMRNAVADRRREPPPTRRAGVQTESALRLRCARGEESGGWGRSPKGGAPMFFVRHPWGLRRQSRLDPSHPAHAIQAKGALDLAAYHVPTDRGDGPVGPSFEPRQESVSWPGTNAGAALSSLRTIPRRSSAVMSSQGTNRLRCDRPKHPGTAFATRCFYTPVTFDPLTVTPHGIRKWPVGS